MSKKLYGTATGTTGILSVMINEAHTNATAAATVKAEDTSLSIGDAISLDIGYETDHTVVFNGYVKKIVRSIPEDIYEIQAFDVLSRAKDYFIASANPDAPFTRFQINAEDLIQDLLALAQLTNYTADPTSFIYAWTIPAEINLIGCYDICKQISDMLVWHLWADSTGLVHFEDRKPFIMAGDTTADPALQFLGNVTYTTTDDDLRNRVVIYGANGIFAEAKAASPYLPAGFYKTAVLASSLVIDLQSMADDAASYNLASWNRLRESLAGTIEGDPSLSARDIVKVTLSDLGIDSFWYVFSANHTWSKNGYKIELELRR